MKMTVNISDALCQRTQALAAACGLTLNQFIIDAVEREINIGKLAPAGKKLDCR
jgi:predicted HicB family RNase H-like nuclease